MKLQKLKISELSNYRQLTHQEMMQYVGGYDTSTNSSCFFNCMEYFGKEICGYGNVSCDTYGKAYYKGDGDYQGTGQMGDYVAGPKIFEKDGSINPNLFNFFSHYFKTDASGWTTGSDIASLFATTGSDEKTAIMGAFREDGSTGHCVILTGYDSSTDTYTYYDPSSGSDEEKTVSGSQMLFAGKGGCK